MISAKTSPLRCWMFGVAGSLFLAPGFSQNVLKEDGVELTGSGIDKTHASAIAKVVRTASQAASRMGFNMPPIVHVIVEPGQSTQLTNDRIASIHLCIRSPKDLSPSGGYCFVYGFCHEVAHLAMVRQMTSDDYEGFMTVAFGEGWAHYLGSRLVDIVYEKEGESLWPESYDYRAEGMDRLRRQISSSSRTDPELKGAALWMELATLLPENKLPGLFAAWGRADFEPNDLGKVLREVSKGDPKVGDWWQRARPVLMMTF